MAVLLPNCALRALVRAHPLERDARGRAVRTEDDDVTTRGPFPGYAVELPDHTWKLRADMRLWPLEVGDTIADGDPAAPGTRTWIITQVRSVVVPTASDVDSINILATLEPPAHL